MINPSCRKLKQFAYEFSTVGAFYFLLATGLSQAQVVEDNTLSTSVNSSDNLNFTVTGGQQVESNLFHSFKQLSVPTGGSVIFDNATNIQNIFSRVTGDAVSHLNGLIKANGSANLFLLNPNGIIFGENAELNLGGSFFATTAEQIVFADGGYFSANDLQPSPLLTVSIPIGLQFGERAASIEVNRSSIAFSEQQENTLGLLGGDVFLNSGILNTIDGKIEIGSVASNSFVSLIRVTEGWTLGYDNVQNFNNISLSEKAEIATSGSISLQGRQIAIFDNSLIAVSDGEEITINASESLEVDDSSRIDNITSLSQSSGDIVINTKQLIVRNNSFIENSNEEGSNGQGGNLIINAAEFVEIDGGGEFSNVTTQTFSNRDAGNLEITTPRLILRDGGQISSSTRRFGGDGGSIIINAEESVKIIGKGILINGDIQPSGLLAETTGETTIGNGGNIEINTGNLSIQDGGIISVATTQGSKGRAGNIEIDANFLSLNKGTITAETAQTGGEEGANINIESNLLILQNESQISATASDLANGGNIDINANFVVAFFNQNNDIIAKASQGIGGRIDIITNSIFGIQERSSTPSNNSNDIDPSSDFGLDGTVSINELEVNPVQSLENLPTEVIDVASLVAQNLCQQGRGSEFVLTGKGGIASSPSQTRDSNISEVDLVEPVSYEAEEQSKSRETEEVQPEKIVEAQGWIVSDRGTIELVAHTDTSNVLPQLPKKGLCS